MGTNYFKFVTPNLFINILPLLIIVFLLHVSQAQVDVCGKVNCAQGTCVPNNASIIGFDCVCYNGWKQFQVGPITLPPCVIPNCTLNFQCGSSAPPPPFELPPFDLTNPCNLVWCNEGTCVANGTDHYCQCYEGSANLLTLKGLPCFKQCSLGADCGGLQLGPHITVSPPPSKSSGSNNISKCSRGYILTMGLLLSALILSFIHIIPHH